MVHGVGDCPAGGRAGGPWTTTTTTTTVRTRKTGKNKNRSAGGAGRGGWSASAGRWAKKNRDCGRRRWSSRAREMMCYIRREGVGEVCEGVAAVGGWKSARSSRYRLRDVCVCACTAAAGSSSLARCCRRRGDN